MARKAQIVASSQVHTKLTGQLVDVVIVDVIAWLDERVQRAYQLAR